MHNSRINEWFLRLGKFVNTIIFLYQSNRSPAWSHSLVNICVSSRAWIIAFIHFLVCVIVHILSDSSSQRSCVGVCVCVLKGKGVISSSYHVFFCHSSIIVWFTHSHTHTEWAAGTHLQTINIQRLMFVTAISAWAPCHFTNVCLTFDKISVCDH